MTLNHARTFRVLKEGGVFAVADITLEKGIPDCARRDVDSWLACLAGALMDSYYEGTFEPPASLV